MSNNVKQCPTIKKSALKCAFCLTRAVRRTPVRRSSTGTCAWFCNHRRGSSAPDQEAFKAEKKAHGASFKYTTYRGWLFGKGWLYYNEGTKQVDWPDDL